MTGDWIARLARIGLDGPARELAARSFERATGVYARRLGDTTRVRAWWIPGRIEVLGKHTDYGGGRSLLCTVQRGFHLLAAPREDRLVHLVDASSGAALSGALATDVPSRPGHWTDYPLSVLRRVARDFPEAAHGMDAVILSSLPPAAGLSSSSALVITTFLPLAAFNRLPATPAWRAALPDVDALAGYLGAAENGRAFGPFPADRGVGTHGGSEDHTAILTGRSGELAQYHFLPVMREATAALPDGWCFAIAASGIHAPKGGAVQARYNGLARELAAMLDAWRLETGRNDVSLLAALRSSADAPERLAGMIGRHAIPADDLLARLAQFRAECEEIIPAVTAAIARGDIHGVGPLIDRSQHLAETVLRNQVPETVALARIARELGGAAASAFGAGFGGSVYALVPEASGQEFLERWRRRYLEAFPGHAPRAEFFLTRPGPPATEV